MNKRSKPKPDSGASSVIYTHCNWNLGDHLAHLHYLRKQAVNYPNHQFIHAAKFDFLSQLIEIIADLPNISLIDIAYRPDHSTDSWKNRDNYFVSHSKWADYGWFHIEFYRYLSSLLGLESPFSQPSDLLFDYPSILRKRYPAFDFLVINSPPKSGQLQGFNPNEFEDLIAKLLASGHSVITTAPSSHAVPCTARSSMSVTSIGSLSLGCQYIVGVSTGPSWPTFNVWNAKTVQMRLLMLDRERVLIAPNTEHARNMKEVKAILSDRGLL